MRSPALAAGVATLIAFSLHVPAAHATSPIELSDIALNLNTGGFALNGEAADDLSGRNVSDAGDVNGDGIPDIVIGAPSADPNGDATGKSYVVFGKTSGGQINLTQVSAGIGGFAINGEASEELSGQFVSGAGDVNGDGLADIVIGAARLNPSPAGSNKSYVVFGKANGTTVELSSVVAGFGGFVINSAEPYDAAGRVSGAGDVNGDDLDDVVIGAPQADNADGKAYVVFGKANGAAVELLSVEGGTGGFAINNDPDGPLNLGDSVSGAGDVNGDGLSDVIVGGSILSYGQTSTPSFVVFGKAGTAPVEVADVAGGTGGFAITVEISNIGFGRVSGAGDVNGDGLDDVIVSRPNFARVTQVGRSYVIFGKEDGAAVNFSQPTPQTIGFVITGVSDDFLSGWSVSGAGDVNGDGLADVIVGSPFADTNGSNSGSSYVVFGKSDNVPVEISDIATGTGGFAMRGEPEYGRAGWSVSGTGDMNGDGLDDLVIGAYLVDANGENSGRSYVVFSPETPPPPPSTVWVDFAFGGLLPLGTENNPFDTLQDAIDEVAAGGTINVKGDTTVSSSSEIPTIDKPMAINAVNGPVTIGGP